MEMIQSYKETYDMLVISKLTNIWRHWAPNYSVAQDFLRLFEGSARSELVSAMDAISLAPPKPSSFHCDLSFLVGQDWDEHALRYRPFIWPKRPKERDITELIAEVLNYEYRQTRHLVLAETFVRTLFKLCEKNDAVCFSGNPEAVEIIAEELTYATNIVDNRIDLSFYWPSACDVKAIIIEAKFDALLNNNLQTYHEHCSNRCRELRKRWFGLDRTENSSPEILKVLLVERPPIAPKSKSEQCDVADFSQTGGNDSTAEPSDVSYNELSPDEYNTWKYIFWRQLLAGWENELMHLAGWEDGCKRRDSTFPNGPEHKRCRDYGGQLRATIYKKLYGAPNG